MAILTKLIFQHCEGYFDINMFADVLFAKTKKTQHNRNAGTDPMVMKNFNENSATGARRPTKSTLTDEKDGYGSVDCV